MSIQSLLFALVCGALFSAPASVSAQASSVSTPATPATPATPVHRLPSGPAAVGPARLAVGVVLGRTATPSTASDAVAAPEPGSELTISLLTFGPGDHPFFKFGHDAIWIHDEISGLDPVYNFGTFGFESAWLILDFLKGKLRYWLSVEPLDLTILAYRSENRSVEAQELNLTPAERLALARALAENARPENKYYQYDYYLDNCATRIRDAIDAATGGRLRAVSGGPAEMTWRDHTLRLTADNLPVYLGLDAAMGDFIDRKITVWDEMFLPAKVQETVRRMRGPGPNGTEPFVRRERLLAAAARPPLRTAPPHWVWPTALAGLLSGGVFVVLAALAARRRYARIAASLVLGLYGLVFGLLGIILSCMWAFTDHFATYRNENILQFSPGAVVLVVAAARLARGRMSGLVLARRVITVVVAGSVAGLLLKATPWFDQDNAELIALLLPLWTMMLTGAYLWERARRA